MLLDILVDPLYENVAAPAAHRPLQGSVVTRPFVALCKPSDNHASIPDRVQHYKCRSGLVDRLYTEVDRVNDWSIDVWSNDCVYGFYCRLTSCIRKMILVHNSDHKVLKSSKLWWLCMWNSWFLPMIQVFAASNILLHVMMMTALECYLLGEQISFLFDQFTLLRLRRITHSGVDKPSCLCLLITEKIFISFGFVF